MLNVEAFYVLVVLSYLGAFYGRGLLWRWLRSGREVRVLGAVRRGLDLRGRLQTPVGQVLTADQWELLVGVVHCGAAAEGLGGGSAVGRARSCLRHAELRVRRERIQHELA